MLTSRRLIIAHFWLAFAVFGVALILGAWQMLVRSPLHPWIGNPEWYYRSVTAHGTIMGYVFPTLEEQASEKFLGGETVKAVAATSAFLKEQGKIDAVLPDYSKYVTAKYVTDALASN